MKLSAVILALTATMPLSSTAWAFGDVGQWSSGWGQGVSEYMVVDAKGNKLYIACSPDENVKMILTTGGKDYGSYGEKGFDLIIDGDEIWQPYSEAHAAQGSFLLAWNGIRSGKKLQAKTEDGKLIDLPLKNAAKALPKPTAKDFPCKTEW